MRPNLPCLLAAALIASTAAAQHHSEAPAAGKPAVLLSGTGSHRHPIATSSPEAQKFFDQGVTMLFGFNHEEAERSFARAAELDPAAAMPRWGLALALGANYNDPAPEAVRLAKARAEIDRALALSVSGPASERAYVLALAVRYSADPNADKAQLARDYAAAMKELSKAYPDDLDAATLYAESLMNLRPWKLWKADGTPEEGTEEILAVLESVIRRDPQHPGANHYYIHAVEASKSPERALPSAARLETLVPAAGHLVHMPAHIYMRTGDYLAAEKSNAAAADVDRAYIRQTGATGMYPLMYYNHNVQFQSAAAAMAGRYAEAKKSADVLFAEVLPAVPEMAMLEGFLVTPAFVVVRFRKWEEVRSMPDPGPRLPLVRAMWLWSRGAAAAAAGQVKSAEKERAAFRALVQTIPGDTLWGPQNTAAGALAVAGFDLDARIALASGDRKAAIASWEKAVAAEDRLAYDEPPAWLNPMREPLGAALYADGQFAAAEAVFRADLENPATEVAHGLWQSLEAQKRASDAAWARTQFEAAWKNADVTLRIEDF
jgi:tetratricopeptide (TPR) repeat protein